MHGLWRHKSQNPRGTTRMSLVLKSIWLSSNDLVYWFMFNVPWSVSGTTGTKKYCYVWCWLWHSKRNLANTNLNSMPHHKFFNQVRSRAFRSVRLLRLLDFCRFWSAYSFYLFFMGFGLPRGFIVKMCLHKRGADMLYGPDKGLWLKSKDSCWQNALPLQGANKVDGI